MKKYIAIGLVFLISVSFLLSVFSVYSVVQANKKVAETQQVLKILVNNFVQLGVFTANEQGQIIINPQLNGGQN